MAIGVKMFSIPTWTVALASLILTIIVFTTPNNVKISIKVFSLTSFMQFMIYALFFVIDLPDTTIRFIVRSNMIIVCVVLSIIILGARMNTHGN